MTTWSVLVECPAPDLTQDHLTAIAGVLSDYGGLGVVGGPASERLTVTVMVEAPDIRKAASTGLAAIIGGLAKAGLEGRDPVRLEVVRADELG